MDFCRNIPVAGGGLPSEYQPEQLLSSSNCSTKLGSLDDLFSSHNMVEGDMGLEWLSIFVEDCFSSTGNCLPLPTNTNHELQKKTNDKDTTSKSLQSEKTQKNYPTTSSTGSSLRKARSKRKRGGSSLTKSKTQLSSIWSHHNHPLDQNSSDPPLLHQAYWLADSELILPKKKTERAAAAGVGGGEEEEGGAKDEEEVVVGNRGSLEGSNGQQQQGLGQQGRRCSHCQSQRTPQWRAGPKGPKTLCNACGVRYKSGRLLPEYRPAKSPTFVSYKHSNSHRKVLEMRNTTTVMAPIPRQLL